jgi:hypothetical protein
VLKKLLSSKDPVDLHAANRLIKNLVEEESQRIERRAELHSLLDRIETSTSLLVEMLSQRKIDKEIVDELADSCKTLRQRLGGVATETNDETTSLLQASENLEKVLILYEERKNSKDVEEEESDLGISFGGAAVTQVSRNENQRILSLADEFLMGLDIDVSSEPTDKLKGAGAAAGVLRETATAEDGNGNADNLLDLDVSLPSSFPKRVDSREKEIGSEGLDEIGRLSRELMDLGLKGNNFTPISAPQFKKQVKNYRKVQFYGVSFNNFNIFFQD